MKKRSDYSDFTIIDCTEKGLNVDESPPSGYIAIDPVKNRDGL
ncbi:MAG: hypothetical protein Barrevirus10_16, partial [Barrevirus sp.]